MWQSNMFEHKDALVNERVTKQHSTRSQQPYYTATTLFILMWFACLSSALSGPRAPPENATSTLKTR
jgi:hypothetical protein